MNGTFYIATYVGPTNTLPSRIKLKNFRTGKVTWLTHDYSSCDIGHQLVDSLGFEILDFSDTAYLMRAPAGFGE